ncbi:MAG: glycosyltransferase family 4 protein [Fimbriimonadaceae bacterium]|nr:glycosyltransferase family 4 protein [Fimbriimonadaceae bacterium]
MLPVSQSDRSLPEVRLTILGTFPPRRCGIATFSHDLRQAIGSACPQLEVRVMAMDDGTVPRYGKDVSRRIAANNLSDYRSAAEAINTDGTDVMLIQHEYGIFGGPDGALVLELARRVNIPIVTTLHTVLDDPSPAQRLVMDELLQLSQRVVVMSHSAKRILLRVHGIHASRIDFIPHGIPDIAPGIGASIRASLPSGPILLTFGLLSPSKGIQHVIEAMPRIVATYPDARYIVLGATHPHVRASEGEQYRNQLQRLSNELGVTGHMQFIDRFVDLAELTQYLDAADYYVTPYLNPRQITSGTLAYSMATSASLISTPYEYAKELLSDGRGALVPFGNGDAIAEAVLASFPNPAARRATSDRVRAFARGMTWARVGMLYGMTSASAVREARVHLVPATITPPVVHMAQGPSWAHLHAMCDDTGIFQHAEHNIVRREDGYCIDDNARALLLSAYLESAGELPSELNRHQSNWLAFVRHAYHPGRQRFRNFMSYSREWLESEGSEDSQARAVWALGEMVRRTRHPTRRAVAADLFMVAAGSMHECSSPRAQAYAILGAGAAMYSSKTAGPARRLLQHLGHGLATRFDRCATEAWPWLEPRLAYANARIPQALIIAGASVGRPEWVRRGVETLTWLMQGQVEPISHRFHPVGAAGAGPDEFGSLQFDQQPIEAWACASACLTAMDHGEHSQFFTWAECAYAWFHGGNALGISMSNPLTGGGYDGLHVDRRNENQGAESTLAWLTCHIEMQWQSRLKDQAIPSLRA